MKTSVINNALLSLIVIENDIHEFIIYNEKAEAFKKQFEKYVDEVKSHIQDCGSTKAVSKMKNEQQRKRKAQMADLLNAREFHPTINLEPELTTEFGFSGPIEKEVEPSETSSMTEIDG